MASFLTITLQCYDCTDCKKSFVMGQASSHKQMRNDFLKNAHVNPQTGYNTQSSYNPSMDFGYQGDDMIEDEEVSIGPTIGSRNSYSPSDSIPTFKFPNNQIRVEPVIKKLPVVFKYSGKMAKEVFLVGTFTSWKDKIQMIKSDGDFMVIVELPEGEHQYKFVVDGKWEHDANQASIDDTFNGRNNVVTVKKSDFEVMDALEIDSMAPVPGQKGQQGNDDLSKSPPGEYTDELPVRGLHSMSMDKPPYLPPQLLNIVLNKDTSARCEPALLPEPNHVMLKHLYALSIRDGVMVLSSTYRFKQKFVTTCFYKPI
ncbi:unnamed protein product [Brachionus calyciflorus]|uniref:5'-AMP-activated protein kinase subunit beta-1 n=1 Tax=Brachionus calyciflorus TaxID=104777 RepID=A0A814MBW1_9BILA|nr:unnamed protein product [Brachionus calyciflorus]